MAEPHVSVATAEAAASVLPRRRAILFIVFLGIVSLFGDMTYEGARSITGPYLGMLGVTATTIGIVSGFGELMGYGARLVSGYVGDRSGNYWAVTIVGYVLNLFAVPLLALAGAWQLAVVLIIAERIGRGIRAPVRDAMLSHAASQTGLGWGFGLHQALDQIGAVIGPLSSAASCLSGAAIKPHSAGSSSPPRYRWACFWPLAIYFRARTISSWHRRPWSARGSPRSSGSISSRL